MRLCLCYRESKPATESLALLGIVSSAVPPAADARPSCHVSNEEPWSPACLLFHLYGESRDLLRYTGGGVVLDLLLSGAHFVLIVESSTAASDPRSS